MNIKSNIMNKTTLVATLQDQLDDNTNNITTKKEKIALIKFSITNIWFIIILFILI